MSYFNHLKLNWKTGFKSLKNFFECFIHGLSPFKHYH